MAKKRTTAKASEPGTGSGSPEPAHDRLIEPSLIKIAEYLKSGKLTPERMARPIQATWSATVPRDLRPFLESRSLNTLAKILKAHSSLYWHPLVVRQANYLRRLRSDRQEWERLGWKARWDDKYQIERSPEEVATVNQHLADLVEAHIAGLFPYRRIEWKRAAKKPGPKGGLKNPHPNGPWTEWISADWLDEDFHHLRIGFKTALRSAPPGRLKAEAKEWYRKIAEQVLAELSASDGVGWWSGFKDYQWTKGPIGTSQTANQDDPASLTPASPENDLEQTLDRPVTEELVERWKPLNLDHSLDKLLDLKMGRAGRSGKPGYLAYSVLAALLDVTPEKIRDTLDNLRSPRRRK